MDQVSGGRTDQVSGKGHCGSSEGTRRVVFCVRGGGS